MEQTGNDYNDIYIYKCFGQLYKILLNYNRLENILVNRKKFNPT